MADFDIKKVDFETQVLPEIVTFESVVIRTKMTKSEFFSFVDALCTSVGRSDSVCYEKYCNARKELEDDVNNRSLAWNKDYWFNEWSKMTAMSDLLKKWLKEHKEWDPDYVEGMTDDEEY